MSRNPDSARLLDVHQPGELTASTSHDPRHAEDDPIFANAPVLVLTGQPISADDLRNTCLSST